VVKFAPCVDDRDAYEATPPDGDGVTRSNRGVQRPIKGVARQFGEVTFRVTTVRMM
jgi:hypothetical protein